MIKDNRPGIKNFFPVQQIWGGGAALPVPPGLRSWATDPSGGRPPGLE
jgi:hypothetical protein